MKKLKIVLLCSFLFISFLFRFFQKSESKYDGSEKIIYGTVINYSISDDKISIILKGKENILVSFKGSFNFSLGQKVKVYGAMNVISNNTIFNLFNYKNYLLSKGIKYIFIAKKIKIISADIGIKYNIKNKILKHINSYKSKRYLKSLILNENADIEKDVLESYRINGISHLFAISGTHIMIISWLLRYVFEKLFKNRGLSIRLIILFLIYYLFLVDFSPSVLRAVLIFVMINLKKYFKFEIKNNEILIIICLTLLNINPYYVYNLGFSLSFIVSFFLITFGSVLSSNNYFIKVFKVSLMAFASSAPLLINTSYNLNLLSPILNVLFVPFIGLLIYPLALITIFLKPFDLFFNCVINFLESLSVKISSSDFLSISMPHFDLTTLFVYYFLLFVLLKVYQKKRENLFLLIVIFIFVYHRVSTFNIYTSVTMLDVNQGDCSLISLPNGKGNILIDTGGETKFNDKSSNIAQKKIVPFLNSIGINKLTYLIISHGDFDHMGEAINLVNNFKVEKVIFNCGEFNDLEKELIKVLDKKKIKYYSCIKELNIDKNKLYFLQTKEYDNENDNSNVIYTEFNGYKFMFMGDASITTEKEILNKYNLPDIDVLKVGHHGSKTSSSESFVNTINPKYSVISVGKNNRYGHPNKEVLNNLEGSKIYRTDKDGSIMFKIKNNKLRIETCSP